MVTVVKKDRSVRICLDARHINSVTIPDHEGAIPINEVLSRCGDIKVMASIDLTSSFWQVPLAEESRDVTGFLYNGKCYRYTVTPFGLKLDERFGCGTDGGSQKVYNHLCRRLLSGVKKH